jgi:hypothetical protein
MRMRALHLYAVAVVLAAAWFGVAARASAAGFQVLTTGKIARFENRGDAALNGGVVVVGRDRALQVVHDPSCPATSSVEVEAYVTSTFRDVVLVQVDLNCTNWTRTASGYRYSDPYGPVRAIYYSRIGLRIDLGGPDFVPIVGPVGYVQAQLQISDQILRARFHNFRRNDAQVVWSRRPSTAASLGEAAFWDVLLGDDSSEPHEQETRQLLERALRYDRTDGRSHFLLAMLHLYRFAQRVEHFDQVSSEALDELVAANASFANAVPLLWNDAARIGDSRVAGFAAASKYTQGALQHDDALRAQGLTELEHAVEVNSFFNVFDYIPVLQLLPPSDPLFQRAFADFTTYLTDPATLQCVGTQPEICSNAGFAPHNIQGSLTLFGDIYAKAGNLAQAQSWYSLVGLFPDTPSWPFRSIVDDRRANAAQRVALYADDNPSNDPSVIGMGAEACANCHNR